MHPITDKIFGWIGGSKQNKQEIDHLITSWLSEAAKKLCPNFPHSYTAFSPDKINEILGLEQESKHEKCYHLNIKPIASGKAYAVCPDCKETVEIAAGTGGSDLMEDSKDWWCGHRNLYDGKWHRFSLVTNTDIEIEETDNFCSRCGAPRPKQLSLEEKFIEWHKKSDYTSKNQDLMAKAKELVKIAEEHFKTR